MKRSSLFMIGALLAGVVAGSLTVSYVSLSKHQKNVLEASRNLPAYTQIQASDVKVVSVSQQAVETDSYLKPEDVIGKYTSMGIETDTQMRPGEVVSGATQPAGLLSKMNAQSGKDTVLIAVPLQKTDLGSGIQQGDYVNLVGITKDGQQINETKVQNIQVMKVDPGDKNSNLGPTLWATVPKDQTDLIHKAVVAGTVRVELLAKGSGN